MNKWYEDELHARPSIPIEAPKLISTIAFMVKDQEVSKKQSKEIEYLSKDEIESFINYVYGYYQKNFSISMKKCNERAKLASTPKYDAYKAQTSIQTRTEDNNGKEKINYFVLLQKHTSFFCITFIEDTQTDILTAKPKWSAIPDDIRTNQKSVINKAMFKTNLRVEKFDPNEREQYYKIKDTFNIENNDQEGYKIEDVFINLFGSKVSDGGAIVWTPFRSFDDGFNRILVRDISLKPGRLGRLVHRLIEVDLYLSVALYNSNRAREQLNKLKGYEYEISNQLDTFESNNNYHNCYKIISDKAKELANEIAETRYEFQAAIAYSDLVWQRINEFREERIEGWTRIGYFLEKSFRPGIRTCEAALRSQNAVSQEIQGVANLLQAGLSLKLQEQQVKTQEEQNRFKTLIEYISIIPISYYGSHILVKFFSEFTPLYTTNKDSMFWIISLIIGFVVFQFYNLFRKNSTI